MSEEEKPFTVSDRRHFTPEGSVRDAAAPDPEPVSPRDDGAREAASAPAVDLAGFLVSLGAQAASLLEAGGRNGDDATEALLGAKSIIAILEMLHDKTEGRRTEEESRVLDALLYELRLGYVRASRAVRP
jgi:hypothetical protein